MSWVVYSYVSEGSKTSQQSYPKLKLKCSGSELILIFKPLADDDATIDNEKQKAYDGLVNGGYKKYYRVKHDDSTSANGKPTLMALKISVE